MRYLSLIFECCNIVAKVAAYERRKAAERAREHVVDIFTYDLSIWLLSFGIGSTEDDISDWEFSRHDSCIVIFIR